LTFLALSKQSDASTEVANAAQVATTTKRRCPTKMAQIRQKRPDSGRGFQLKVHKKLEIHPSSLRSGSGKSRAAGHCTPLPDGPKKIVNTLKRFNAFHLKNGWSHGQNLALTP